jgi:hypothetical protein
VEQLQVRAWARESGHGQTTTRHQWSGGYGRSSGVDNGGIGEVRRQVWRRRSSSGHRCRVGRAHSARHRRQRHHRTSHDREKRERREKERKRDGDISHDFSLLLKSLF